MFGEWDLGKKIDFINNMRAKRIKKKQQCMSHIFNKDIKCSLNFISVS